MSARRCFRCQQVKPESNYLKRSDSATLRSECQGCAKDRERNRRRKLAGNEKIDQRDCLPWPYELDEQDRPIDQAGLFRPGNRRCGHRDCINPNHIEATMIKETK